MHHVALLFFTTLFSTTMSLPPSLADQLRRVKLRSVSHLHPQKIGHEYDTITEEDQARIHDGAKADKWVSQLGHHTFATEWVELDKESAEMFVKAYEVFRESRGDSDKNEELERMIQDLDETVGREIDEAMKKLNGVCMTETCRDGGFVKLSSRSPKDAAVHMKERMKELYQTTRKSFNTHDDNTKIWSMLQASTDIMHFRNGREVIELFVRSQRVYEDLEAAMKRKDGWNEKIIIRKWVQLSIDLEFRGFVKDGELTALTQYNFAIYSERVQKNKKHIEERIRRFFEKTIRPKLTDDLRSGIFDFAIVNLGEANEKIYVIEMNPFLESTHAGLFSWRDDNEQLKRGPFEFRTVERRDPDALSNFDAEWRSYLDYLDQ